MVASKKFTLKYMDGHEEHYENYRYYERLRGNEKIVRRGITKHSFVTYQD